MSQTPEPPAENSRRATPQRRWRWRKPRPPAQPPLPWKPTRWGNVPIPYGRPVDELAKHLEHPGPAAWAAITALADDPSPQALAVLTRCARSADWCFRRIAIEAVAQHALAHTASDLIVAALRDPSSYVVRTACEAVARLGHAEAHDDVRSLLSAPEAATRVAAIRALESVWWAGDHPGVFHVSLSDPSPAVRRQAAWTLSARADARSWPELFHAWRSDKLPRHRVWACELARRFGDETIRAQLEDLARDPNGHVRKAAERALREITG